MARVVRVIAEELKNQGYSEMWVADSHGFMGNLLYFEVPNGVYIVRGL